MISEARFKFGRSPRNEPTVDMVIIHDEGEFHIPLIQNDWDGVGKHHWQNLRKALSSVLLYSPTIKEAWAFLRRQNWMDPEQKARIQDALFDRLERAVAREQYSRGYATGVADEAGLPSYENIQESHRGAMVDGSFNPRREGRDGEPVPSAHQRHAPLD